MPLYTTNIGLTNPVRQTDGQTGPILLPQPLMWEVIKLNYAMANTTYNLSQSAWPPTAVYT